MQTNIIQPRASNTMKPMPALLPLACTLAVPVALAQDQSGHSGPVTPASAAALSSGSGGAGDDKPAKETGLANKLQNPGDNRGNSNP
jgi:hypothetical protein